MKTYHGWIDDGGRARVWRCMPNKKTIALPLFLAVQNHSPTGFQWGYGGSGPAQLALALLCDVLGDRDRAARLHQPFKRRVIANLKQGKDWMLTEQAIRAVADELEQTQEQPA